VPLIASALVLAAGLALEAWTDDAPEGGGGAALIAIGVAGAMISGLLAVRPIAPAATRGVAGSALVLVVGLPAIVWATSGVLLPDRPVQAAIPTGTNPPGTGPAVGDPARGDAVDESAPHTHAPGDTTHSGTSDSGTSDSGTPDSGTSDSGTSSEAADEPEFHTHGVATPEVALDPLTRAQLGDQLVIAREVALSYPTVADAEGAGYRKVTNYLPLIGAHYMRFANLANGFAPAEPEMLLFDGTDPDSRIVGLSYFVTGGIEPAGFAGPNDHWHQHKGLCLRGTFVVGGERVSEAECARRGGRKANDLDAWMVHAWVVPGWESPQGVFSPEHPGLV
jgi:hypothetical protein